MNICKSLMRYLPVKGFLLPETDVIVIIYTYTHTSKAVQNKAIPYFPAFLGLVFSTTSECSVESVGGRIVEAEVSDTRHSLQ